MNQIENPSKQFTDADFFDASCIMDQMLEVVIDQVAFLVMDYITPTVKFRVSFILSTESMTGFGIVERQYSQVLAAIHSDPRPRKVVGQPVQFSGEDVPAPIAAFIMIAANAPEIFDDSDDYFAFDITATPKQ
nr:hypothetical protein [Ralstonia mannitolilytica]